TGMASASESSRARVIRAGMPRGCIRAAVDTASRDARRALDSWATREMSSAPTRPATRPTTATAARVARVMRESNPSRARGLGHGPETDAGAGGRVLARRWAPGGRVRGAMGVGAGRTETWDVRECHERAMGGMPEDLGDEVRGHG